MIHSPISLTLRLPLLLGDTVLIAPTGAGKTLVLAMPLLYHKTKVSIVISPLRALETDQALKMNQLGIKSILVDSADLPKEDVQVCDCILCTPKSFHLHGLQDIENGIYHLIFTSLEMLEQNKKLSGPLDSKNSVIIYLLSTLMKFTVSTSGVLTSGRLTIDSHTSVHTCRLKLLFLLVPQRLHSKCSAMCLTDLDFVPITL